MRLPPYGREVASTPEGYWSRGTRVMIFAGPAAWDWARWWLDDGCVTTMGFARHRYTCVLPPDMTEHAEVYTWPVAQRQVVVDAGLTDAELEPLIRAIGRDGCAGAVRVETSDLQASWDPDFELQRLQPWSEITWDSTADEKFNARVEALVEVGPRPGEYVRQTSPPWHRSRATRVTREESIELHADWIERHGERAIAFLERIVDREFMRELRATLTHRSSHRQHQQDVASRSAMQAVYDLARGSA